MNDKNNVELKTGQLVKIENGFFKCDNGLYRVAHSPGDPDWLGKTYSLRKVNKNGSDSTAKYKYAFWPLESFCNDRAKNDAAKTHNKEFATIEVF